MQEKTDEQLVALCLNGEKAAFNILIQRYERQVISLAYNLCKNYDEAADLAQEAFIHIYKVLDKFDQERKFFPWMYSIARNICINHIQKLPKEQLALNTAINVEPIFTDSINEQPDLQYEQKETMEEIIECIDSLPKNYRVPIVLRYASDMSYKEIADQMDLSLSAVETRLFRGRKMLQEKLTKINKNSK